MIKCQYLYLIGGFKHEFYVPCHTWDVINVILSINFHSIIFQDGHVAPPTRYEKPRHETKKRSLEETAYFFRQPFLRRERIGCFVTHILWWSLVQNAPRRNSPEFGYKWRFLAGKIIHFYGPSIPWQSVSHNQRVYPQIEWRMIPWSHHPIISQEKSVEANAEYWRSFGFLASTDFDCAMETVGGLRIRQFWIVLINHKQSHFVNYTLWLFNIAVENGPFIRDFPWLY